MTATLIVVLILTSFFTVGGISLVVAGELAGLPLAVGGAVLQIGAIVLVVATLRVRRTLDDRTVARPLLVAARRIAGWVRRIVLGTLVVLLVYGLVRLLSGDRWSLVTACIISVGLLLLARGSKAIALAQDQALNLRST